MGFSVKITTFPSLLDLLAPHSCRGCGRLGDVLCDRCKNYITSHRTALCPNCGKPNVPTTSHSKAKKSSFLKYRKSKTLPTECNYCHLPLAYVVGEREGPLGALIHDYKYNSTRAAGAKLAELLAEILPSDLPPSTVIVPLPTASQHIRERGLDHTYKIAKKLAHLRGFEVQKLLLREHNTVQVGASRKDRLKQAAKAYSLDSAIPLDPAKTYILLDDVWTTGASMKAALELFRAKNIKNLRIALLATSQD